MPSIADLSRPRPLITVIVAVYNGAATLQQCIDSVISQSYPYKELVVIDGGSTDGAVEVIRSNEKEISFWVSEPDRGIYDAWNKGLDHANGDWICFLGADDYFWDPQVMSKVADELVRLPANIRIAYGRIMAVDLSGRGHLVGDTWERSKGRFRQVMSITHPGMMHRRDLFEQHGKFDPAFRIAGDYELLLRELKSADAYFISDIVLVGMRQGGISSDPENAWLGVRELRLAQQKNQLGAPGRLWWMMALKSYLRMLLWRALGKRWAIKILDWRRVIMRHLAP